MASIQGAGLAKIIGEGLFYASLQAAIGSVEMSSRFSVMNFSKDQETLQRAADALMSYMIVAVVWTLATMLAMYASYGWCGASIGLACNSLMMGWIFGSYVQAFKQAANMNGLQFPNLW